jgi:hypothetical protein
MSTTTSDSTATETEDRLAIIEQTRSNCNHPSSANRYGAGAKENEGLAISER